MLLKDKTKLGLIEVDKVKKLQSTVEKVVQYVEMMPKEFDQILSSSCKLPLEEVFGQLDTYHSLS